MSPGNSKDTDSLLKLLKNCFVVKCEKKSYIKLGAVFFLCLKYIMIYHHFAILVSFMTYFTDHGKEGPDHWGLRASWKSSHGGI